MPPWLRACRAALDRWMDALLSSVTDLDQEDIEDVRRELREDGYPPERAPRNRTE